MMMIWNRAGLSPIERGLGIHKPHLYKYGSWWVFSQVSTRQDWIEKASDFRYNVLEKQRLNKWLNDKREWR